MVRTVLAVALPLLFATIAQCQTLPTELLSSDAKVIKLAGGFGFTEGPVWLNRDDGYLVFSDISGDQLNRWDAKNGVSIFRKPSHNTNGNTLARDGRLISCEQALRRLAIETGKGTTEAVVDSFNGKKFNSPNDVVVKSDGTIWFTDPPYGLPNGEKSELEHQYVFCFDPKTKAVVSVVDDFDRPNGLCFSPDEKKLYIADSGRPHHIRVFDVEPRKSDSLSPPWTLKNGKVFCVIKIGIADGIRADEHGNIWAAAGDGVHVFSPDGSFIGKILVPEMPANLCFGGADGKMLFITARTSLYSIQTKTTGPH